MCSSNTINTLVDRGRDINKNKNNDNNNTGMLNGDRLSP
jgi:hypothetical protein